MYWPSLEGAILTFIATICPGGTLEASMAGLAFPNTVHSWPRSSVTFQNGRPSLEERDWTPLGVTPRKMVSSTVLLPSFPQSSERIRSVGWKCHAPTSSEGETWEFFARSGKFFSSPWMKREEQRQVQVLVVVATDYRKKKSLHFVLFDKAVRLSAT